MKTKIFKIGMPLMVFMLAIVFAFATEKTTAKSESLAIQGYVFKDGTCQISRFCDNTGGPVCRDADGLAVHLQQTATCSVQMTQWP